MKNKKKLVFAGKRPDVKNFEIANRFYKRFINSEFDLKINTDAFITQIWYSL